MKQILHLAKSYAHDPKNWLRNIKWRCPKTISSKKHIFVVGSPRSGTTLLQRILTVHPELFSIEGETGIFSYQNIFSRRHFGLTESELNELYNTSTDIVEFFDNSIKILEKQNLGKTFVEKTPQHILHIDFLIKHFPNASFIHIYRDGRDCYISSLKHPNVPQRRSPVTFARYWRKCIKSWEAVHPAPNLYEIKYENLASRPESELQNLMHFLGLKLDARQLDPEYISQDHRAKRDEFKKLKEPINRSSCGRWEKELSKEGLNIFLEIAGDQLSSLGYQFKAQQDSGGNA